MRVKPGDMIHVKHGGAIVPVTVREIHYVYKSEGESAFAIVEGGDFTTMARLETRHVIPSIQNEDPWPVYFEYLERR